MQMGNNLQFLRCKDNGFELEVVGYQFPAMVHEPYDADWLNVAVRVEHARGTWSKTDACLLTWELIELADWFDGINGTRSLNSTIDFLEPELAFEWIGDQCVLRIYINYSLRPIWSPYHGPHEEPELFVECPMSPNELSRTAAALRQLTERFPIRVKPE